MKPSADLDPLLRPLLPKYLAARDRENASLRQALNRQDFPQIADVGHRLAGSGTSYGFPQISILGRRLEAAGNARDPKAAGEAIDEVEALVRAALANL